jgi:hypothetical protein
MTHVLEGLFDIRSDVRKIVSLLQEEDGDGEQEDEAEDS